MSALIKPRLLVPMLALAACFALAGPMVATASASDSSIIGVVNHWSPIVLKDEKTIAKAEKAYKRNRQAAPLVAGLTPRGVRPARVCLTAPGAVGVEQDRRQGPDDIADGTTLIARSYAKFASELKQAGSKGLSQAQISANKTTEQAGHQKIVAGIKLLQKLT